MEEIQTHIESSKFESGDLELTQIQKLTGDAQIIFVLLLSLARQSREIAETMWFGQPQTSSITP